MPVFLIADVKVTDDAWIPDYAAKVHNIVAKHGGKYLSRSGNIGGSAILVVLFELQGCFPVSELVMVIAG